MLAREQQKPLPFYFLIFVKSYVFAFSSCLSLSDYSLHSLSAPFQLTNIHFQIVFWEKYWVFEGPQYINGQIISGCLLENAQSWQTDGLTSSLDEALAFRLWVHSLSPTWSSKQNEFGDLISAALAQSHYAYFSRGLTIYSISFCFEEGNFSSHAAWMLLGTWWRRFLHAAGWS